MDYSILVKNGNNVYRVPEDIFPFAAERLLSTGQAERLPDERPSLLGKAAVRTAMVVGGAQKAARHFFPFGPAGVARR